MSSQAAGFAGAAGVSARRATPPAPVEPLGRLGRCAHWLAPLLAAGLLGACTFLMFAARGAAVI